MKICRSTNAVFIDLQLLVSNRTWSFVFICHRWRWQTILCMAMCASPRVERLSLEHFILKLRQTLFDFKAANDSLFHKTRLQHVSAVSSFSHSLDSVWFLFVWIEKKSDWQDRRLWKSPTNDEWTTHRCATGEAHAGQTRAPWETVLGEIPAQGSQGKNTANRIQR